MNGKEIKEMYKELKRNKKIIGSIDVDFFFEFADALLNLLEKRDKETEYWKNGFERELESNKKNIIKIIKKDKQIDEMAKKINEAYFESGDFEEWFENKICKVQKYEDYTYLEKDIKQHFERKVENEN